LEYAHICAYDRAVTSFSTELGARVIRGEGDPLAELVRVHRFAEGLTELRAINPDEPPHLTRSVVLTEGR
jgi:hypothetical protein